MAVVVSLTEIQKRFNELGWTSLGAADVGDFLAKANVSAVAFVAYLDAAKASQAGWNDQTIAGCPPADGTKITNALKARGCGVV